MPEPMTQAELVDAYRDLNQVVNLVWDHVEHATDQQKICQYVTGYIAEARLAAAFEALGLVDLAMFKEMED